MCIRLHEQSVGMKRDQSWPCSDVSPSARTARLLKDASSPGPTWLSDIFPQWHEHTGWEMSEEKAPLRTAISGERLLLTEGLERGGSGRQRGVRLSQKWIEAVFQSQNHGQDHNTSILSTLGSLKGLSLAMEIGFQTQGGWEEFSQLKLRGEMHHG